VEYLYLLLAVAGWVRMLYPPHLERELPWEEQRGGEVLLGKPAPKLTQTLVYSQSVGAGPFLEPSAPLVQEREKSPGPSLAKKVGEQRDAAPLAR